MSDIIIIDDKNTAVIEAGARGLPGFLNYGLYPAGLLLPPEQVEMVRIFSDVPAGTSTFYTCPAGKKALIQQAIYRSNTSAGTITSSANINLEGNLMRPFTPAAAIGANSLNSVSTANLLLHEADQIQLTATATGLRAFAYAWLLPASAPVKRVYKANINTTPWTLYTCPAGKRAYACSFAPSFRIYAEVAFNPIIVNDSGVTHTIDMYFVPNGETLGPQHFMNRVSIGTGSQSVPALPPAILSPGDALYIQSSTDTPGCHIRMSVIEI